jgi:hypothetical protein
MVMEDSEFSILMIVGAELPRLGGCAGGNGFEFESHRSQEQSRLATIELTPGLRAGSPGIGASDNAFKTTPGTRSQ